MPSLGVLLWLIVAPLVTCSASGGNAAINACLLPAGGKCSTQDSDYLDLSNCGLVDDDIPDIVDCLDQADRGSIDTLDLGANELTTVSYGILANMTNLTSLWINSNDLLTMSSTVFSDLTSLQHTLLYGNDDLQCLPTIPNAGFVGPATWLTASSATLDYDALDASVCDCPDAASYSDCTIDEICSAAVGGYVCDPSPGVVGDPHMTGFKGQKIDWKGEDGAWYVLLSDSHDLQMTVRLTAPLPEDFPDRQLITGFAIQYDSGHSLVIETMNPYSTDTPGCAPDLVGPCLSDGVLKITIDGQVHAPIPVENKHLNEGATMSVMNLPAECQPYGGDVMWARTFEQMTQRRLMIEPTSFSEWVLEWVDSTAAPLWCEKFINDFGAEDLLDSLSKHAVFRIQTSDVSVRLHHGTNHQGGEILEDGRVLPELEFWQMDIHLEGLNVDPNIVTGILGETMRPVLDGQGKPVMTGVEALRGEVKDFRVSGALMSDFHGNRQ